jgi:hypothetical protein
MLVEESLEDKRPTYGKCSSSTRRQRVSSKILKKSQKKEGYERARRLETARNTVFFGCFVLPDARKAGSLKTARAEVAGEMWIQNLHPVEAREGFRSDNR